jgi:GNAT superfamily N-acetyltransferase
MNYQRNRVPPLAGLIIHGAIKWKDSQTPKTINWHMNNLLTRSYRPDDEKAVIQLWIDCDLVVPQNNPKRDIERKLKVNPEWFLVGLFNGEVIATCMVGYEGHRGWINYLAVSPKNRRRGFATQMMNKAENLLKNAGCPKINLQIRDTNSRAIEFYKSIGFITDQVVSMGKRLEPDAPYELEPVAPSDTMDQS